MCHIGLDLKFEANLKLKSGNQKIQYAHTGRASENISPLQCKRGSSKWASPHHKQFATFLRNFYLFKQLLGNFEIWASVRRTLFSDALATRRPFWKWHMWKSSIHTNNVLLKFGLDIQSQTEVTVQKPKNPMWPPGSHFERDISENQQASAHRYKQRTHEIWNWNSQTNLGYAPESMSPTESRNRKIQYGR